MNILPRRVPHLAKRLAPQLALCLALTTAPALADRYESEVYFAKGRWQVEVTHDSQDGSLWCSALTENNNNQSFDITAFDDGQLTLFVFDGDWELRERPIRFLVDVDRSRWTMDGTGKNISVSVTMNDPDTAVRFLTQLQRGNTVRVYNENEVKLATFSLSGSRAGIDALFECWDRINKSSDPFGDASDPFN